MLENINIAVSQRDWKSQVVGGTSITHIVNQIENGSYRSKEVEIDLVNINIENYQLKGAESLFDFMMHYKMVEKADLSYPVILNNRGHIIDGRHRLAKAILQGDTSIKGIQIIEPIKNI